MWILSWMLSLRIKVLFSVTYRSPVLGYQPLVQFDLLRLHSAGRLPVIGGH